jgi:hypothetical protein
MNKLEIATLDQSIPYPQPHRTYNSRFLLIKCLGMQYYRNAFWMIKIMKKPTSLWSRYIQLTADPTSLAPNQDTKITTTSLEPTRKKFYSE